MEEPNDPLTSSNGNDLSTVQGGTDAVLVQVIKSRLNLITVAIILVAVVIAASVFLGWVSWNNGRDIQDISREVRVEVAEIGQTLDCRDKIKNGANIALQNVVIEAAQTGNVSAESTESLIVARDKLNSINDLCPY